mgnify:CR=1 FL=1
MESVVGKSCEVDTDVETEIATELHIEAHGLSHCIGFSGNIETGNAHIQWEYPWFRFCRIAEIWVMLQLMSDFGHV